MLLPGLKAKLSTTHEAKKYLHSMIMNFFFGVNSIKKYSMIIKIYLLTCT